MLLRLGIFKTIIFLLSLSIVIAFLLSSADIGKEHKLFYDLLLFFESFWLHILALLLSYEISKNESSHKLFRIPLSTGLSRTSYELARFLSVVVILIIVFLPILLINAIFTTLLISFQSFLFLISASLTGFLSLTLARFFAPTSAILYSVALLLIGNGLDELYNYALLQADQALIGTANLLYVVLPNFSIFDQHSFVFFPFVYALFLGMLFFVISSYKFNKQAL